MHSSGQLTRSLLDLDLVAQLQLMLSGRGRRGQAPLDGIDTYAPKLAELTTVGMMASSSRSISLGK